MHDEIGEEAGQSIPKLESITSSIFEFERVFGRQTYLSI
jgi:hypothetical protein